MRGSANNKKSERRTKERRHGEERTITYHIRQNERTRTSIKGVICGDPKIRV